VPRDHHLVSRGAVEGAGLRRDYDGLMRRAYIGSTWILSLLMLVLGLVLIVSTLARGGGVATLGVLIGACFMLAGAGRLWLLRGLRGEPR
jgi:hypothetical protein